MQSTNINSSNILEQKVGDILNKFPKTKNFFEDHDIDYCCGGQNTLDKSLTELSLKNQTIINELLDIIQNNCNITLPDDNEIIKSTDFTSKPTSEIVDFVVNYFHKGLREDMPKLNDMILKIMRAHIKNHKELYWKIHELMGDIRILFEAHLILEEENIFKPMLKFESGNLKKGTKEYDDMMNAIKESMTEHSLIGPELKSLSEITNNYTPPQDACNTVKMVYDGLKKLEEHIIAHTQLENNILFPRFLEQ